MLCIAFISIFKFNLILGLYTLLRFPTYGQNCNHARLVVDVLLDSVVHLPLSRQTRPLPRLPSSTFSDLDRRYCIQELMKNLDFRQFNGIMDPYPGESCNGRPPKLSAH